MALLPKDQPAPHQPDIRAGLRRPNGPTPQTGLKRPVTPVDHEPATSPHRAPKRALDTHTAPAPMGRVLRKALPKTPGKLRRDGSKAVAVTQAPAHPLFKPIDGPAAVVSGSVYLIDPKTERMRSIESVTVDGLKIGWERCGSCKSHLDNCRCKTYTMPDYLNRKPGTLLDR